MGRRRCYVVFRSQLIGLKLADGPVGSFSGQGEILQMFERSYFSLKRGLVGTVAKVKPEIILK